MQELSQAMQPKTDRRAVYLEYRKKYTESKQLYTSNNLNYKLQTPFVDYINKKGQTFPTELLLHQTYRPFHALFILVNKSSLVTQYPSATYTVVFSCS